MNNIQKKIALEIGLCYTTIVITHILGYLG